MLGTAEKPCPLCGHMSSQRILPDVVDAVEVRCWRCGQYKIDGDLWLALDVTDPTIGTLTSCVVYPAVGADLDRSNLRYLCSGQ
jgi:hypothetical protein